MNKQRGVIFAGYIWLVGGIIVLALLAGLVMAWRSYTDGIDRKGYDRGVQETDARYKGRDNAALQAALAAQSLAEVRAAKAEKDAQEAQSAASGAYQKGVQYGKAQTDKRIAAVRDGSLVLRDPGTTGTGPAGCPQAGTATTSAGAPRDITGSGGGFLSKDASVFLLSEASRADEIVLQLQAAQQILLSDRKLCNAD